MVLLVQFWRTGWIWENGLVLLVSFFCLGVSLAVALLCVYTIPINFTLRINKLCLCIRLCIFSDLRFGLVDCSVEFLTPLSPLPVQPCPVKTKSIFTALAVCCVWLEGELWSLYFSMGGEMPLGHMNHSLLLVCFETENTEQQEVSASCYKIKEKLLIRVCAYRRL